MACRERIQRSACRLATLQQLSTPTVADDREAWALAYEIEECQADLRQLNTEARERRLSLRGVGRAIVHRVLSEFERGIGVGLLSPGAPRMLHRRANGSEVWLDATR